MFVFNYYFLRGGETSQEANYNVARAFHQCGLNHLAMPYYEKVLKIFDLSTNTDDDGGFQGDNGNSSLVREAAYNLCNIYIQSGNMSLPRILLRKYCTI